MMVVMHQAAMRLFEKNRVLKNSCFSHIGSFKNVLVGNLVD